MSTYTITVNVDPEVLEDLQKTGYKLHYGIPIATPRNPSMTAKTSQGEIPNDELATTMTFDWDVPQNPGFKVGFHTKQTAGDDEFLDSMMRMVPLGRIYEVDKPTGGDDTDLVYDPQVEKVSTLSDQEKGKWIQGLPKMQELGFQTHFTAAPVIYRVDAATGKQSDYSLLGDDNYWVPGRGSIGPSPNAGDIAIWFDFIAPGETTSKSVSEQLIYRLEEGRNPEVTYNAEGEWEKN